MNASIIPLRQLPAGDQIEDVAIGAVLDLPEKLELMEAMGLTRDDFKTPRASIAWFIMKRLAERRLEVSAVMICSAGKRAGLLNDNDLGWLSSLEAANPLSKEQALQIAEDIRVQARARQVRNQLQMQIDLIDRGRFSPSITSGALETIVHGLATDFSSDETADADLMALNASWDKNVAEGRTTLDPTGLRLLDSIIGGWPPNIFFVQGRPGVGKNALLATVIKSQLELDAHLPAAQQSRTGLFGLESGTEWLSNRWQAEGLGIPLRDVGSKKLTPEQVETKTRLDERLYPLLRRVEVFRQDRISRAELLRKSMRWVFQKGVRRIYIDNLREVNHTDPRARLEYWQGVAETVRVMRNFAYRYGIPVGFLVHDTEDDPKPGHEGPPNPKKMAGGQDAGARARLVCGLWSKGSSIRLTVTKANELSAAGMDGPTLEFQRNFEAGTFSPEGGRIVDLGSEAAKERREKRDVAREESVDESLRRAELIKQRKARAEAEKPAAAVAPEPPAQAALLEVPPSSKPETP